MRPFGQHGRRCVGADVAGNARSGVDAGPGQVEVEFPGRCRHRCAGHQRKRGLSERGRIEAEHDVVHDRVGDDDQLENVIALLAGVVE